MREKKKTKNKPAAKTWRILSEYRAELMGAACLLVMLGHFADNNTANGIYETSLFFRFASIGNVGVDIFLFLSGIGLYYSYERSSAGFFKRRLFRVLIPYLIFAVPYYIWQEIAAGGKFIPDILGVSFFTKGDVITWYIPAILIFYLIYPLLHRVFGAAGRLSRSSKFVLLSGGWAAVCILTMKFFPTFYGHTEIMLTRLIIFMAGCCCGKYVRDGAPLPQAAFFASLIYFVFYVFHFRTHVSLPSFYTRMMYAPLGVSVAFVCAWMMGKLPRFFRRALSFVGERSLLLYLSHVLVRKVYFHYTDGVADSFHIVDYIIIIGASFALSISAHAFVSWINKKLAKDGRTE